MNRFKFTVANDDMAVTPVENLFINHYMPRARGDYVKVYLFGLKHSFNHSLDAIDNQMLSKLFDLTEGDIIKAWEYWRDQGIITLEYVGTKDVIITYCNISAMLMEQNRVHVKDTAPSKTDDEESGDARIKDMYTRIEQMYGSRTITQKEVLLFKNMITDYHFTPETVVLLVEYSLNLINKKNEVFTAKQTISYFETVAESWHHANIRDYSDADAYIRQTKDQQKRYYDIFKYLGLRRNPIAWEKEMMDKWSGNYGYTMEIITCAMARSGKPDIRYIDAILKRWYEKGYTTVAEIEAEPKNSHYTAKQPHETPADSDRDKAYEDLENQQVEWLRSLYDDEQ
ncbi:MAG: DnaD domain protein [Eubacterium sp.]